MAAVTPQSLIDRLFESSEQLHPHYSKGDHAIWVMGFAAAIACDGIEHDSMVWHRAQERLGRLTARSARE